MSIEKLFYRKQLLNLLKRRATKRNDSTRHSDRNVKAVGLEEIAFIRSKLSGIPHALIGGQAISSYIKPRSTLDVDFLINPGDVDAAVKALGGVNATPLTIGGVSVKVGNIDVDLIAPDTSWVGEAISSASGGLISKPYLVITKLWASRGEQDDADIIGLVKTMSSKEIKSTKDLISTHMPDQIDDFDQMVEISKITGAHKES